MSELDGGDAYDGLGIEQLIAILRADADSTGDTLEQLSIRLGSALGGRVRARRSGLFGRGSITVLTIDLGDRRFLLERAGHGGLAARCSHVVREVAIRTDDLDLETWIEQLSRALSAAAQESAEARAALERLLS